MSAHNLRSFRRLLEQHERETDLHVDEHSEISYVLYGIVSFDFLSVVDVLHPKPDCHGATSTSSMARRSASGIGDGRLGFCEVRLPSSNLA